MPGTSNPEAIMGKAILRGILWVFAWVFPAALAVGALYRFPVPFRGYVSGAELFQEGPTGTMELIWMLLQAVLYDTVYGGFIVLAILGSVAGLIGWRLGRPDRVNRYTRNIALGLALAAAVVLSVLDKIVGPW
jgi:hypothetical protein